MNNAFAPSVDPEPEPIPLLLATQISMVLVGLFYLLFGLVGLALLVAGVALLVDGSGEEGIILLIEGVLFLIFGTGLGAIIIAAAAALQRRAMWAWIASLVAAAMMLGSPCCLPLGGLWLYTLLQEPARSAFLE